MIQKLYHQIKNKLEENQYTVNPFREIQYGLQFLVFNKNNASLLRLYQSKKGKKLDLSQCQNDEEKERICIILANIIKEHDLIKSPNQKKEASSKSKNLKYHELIGVDESGKGDYFGPLVVAAVYVDKKKSDILDILGVKDSKTLDDRKITELAEQIKETCPFSIINMGNASYNELYEKMQNLNHLLSWGHAKAIENVLKQQPCQTALSDKFAPQTLIKAGLLNKGIDINLIEETKAEQNIAVAAASILARATFIEELQKLSNIYKFKFPKGCSNQSKLAAQHFYEKHGPKELCYIAKLHFKITNELS